MNVAAAASAAVGHCFERIRYTISRVELIDFARVFSFHLLRLRLNLQVFYSLLMDSRIKCKSGFSATKCRQLKIMCVSNSRLS